MAPQPRNLSASEQITEIEDEFLIESAAWREDRLPSTLSHLNALLDAYNVIKVNLLPEGVALGQE